VGEIQLRQLGFGAGQIQQFPVVGEIQLCQLIVGTVQTCQLGEIPDACQVADPLVAEIHVVDRIQLLLGEGTVSIPVIIIHYILAENRVGEICLADLHFRRQYPGGQQGKEHQQAEQQG
jgi:hypothetical protein